MERLLIFFFLFFFSPVYAWNQLGHMVIADIAYHRLDSLTQKKVDSLINVLHNEYENISSLLEMSYWADDLRKQKIEIFTHWHYIDNTFSIDDTPTKNLIDSDNVVWAINQIQTIIKNKNANPYERARFLAFFVHIISDIHQPLHTTAITSRNHPDGDKGGNHYHVLYHGKKENLHHLWDDGVDLFDEDASTMNAHLLATQITTQYPESYFGEQVFDLNPEDWSQEGVILAKEHVYLARENEPLSADYIEDGHRIASQRVALAGYRLAEFLKQVV